MDVSSAWTAHFDESAWLAIKTLSLIFAVGVVAVFGDVWIKRTFAAVDRRQQESGRETESGGAAGRNRRVG